VPRQRSLSLSLSLSLARARDSISVSLSLDLSLTERVVDRCGRTGHAQCYDDGAVLAMQTNDDNAYALCA
jgi:hypothetical protein